MLLVNDRDLNLATMRTVANQATSRQHICFNRWHMNREASLSYNLEISSQSVMSQLALNVRLHTG